MIIKRERYLNELKRLRDNGHQAIVTSTGAGKPIEISAEEAEMLAQAQAD